MTGKFKALITRRWPKETEDRAASLFDVSLNQDDQPLSEAALEQAMRDYDVVCPTVTDGITPVVLDAAPRRCRMLGNFGVGFNHIDLEGAKRNGIVVSNTPNVLTDCTADIAMMLLLMVARRAGEGERHVRGQQWTGWRPTHMLGAKVTGKTLGLIGMGRIARALAHKAHHGFGMRIVFTDPYPPPSDLVNDLSAKAVPGLANVVREADFVSLHCPGGKETKHLISSEVLSMMKSTACLINTARGDVVDQDALFLALKDKRIRGAGLDVYEGEPAVPQGLMELENVVLLPHLGSATEETRIAMGHRALDNVEAFFKDQDVKDRVV